jgi:hypothetical protein
MCLKEYSSPQVAKSPRSGEYIIMASRWRIHLTLLIFEKSKFFLETSLELGEVFDEKNLNEKFLARLFNSKPAKF